MVIKQHFQSIELDSKKDLQKIDVGLQIDSSITICSIYRNRWGRFAKNRYWCTS